MPDTFGDLLPPGTTWTADGVPVIAGCRLDDIVADVGTPAYVVSEDALRARARAYVTEFAARWPKTRVVFASKAFPCTAVQRVMVEEGLGLDVVGEGEMRSALKAGADPATLVLHGNAKLPGELDFAVENGIGLVVVDGDDDVDRLAARASRDRPTDVLVRIIPGVTAETHASILTGHDDSKFGVSIDQARDLIKRIEATPNLRMRGLHLHVGSQIMETEPFALAVAAIAVLGEFEIYDLGGGLGSRYTYADHPAALTDYLDVLTGAARANLPHESELIIEPGRSMVAESTCTVYEVVTVKRGKHTFVAVDGGMGDNLEVSLFQQRFEAEIVGASSLGRPTEICQLVGRHCESGDVLIRDLPMARPEVGDLVVVPATGAYCFTMSNNYNGARRPPVIFASEGQWRTVVRRETYDDLLARDVPALSQ